MKKTLVDRILRSELELPEPLLREQLRACGLSTRKRMRDNYERVSRGIYLPRGHTRDPNDVQWGAHYCPRNFAFEHYMVTRAKAQALLSPNAIFAGWSALRILGLPYWVNNFNVQLLAKKHGSRAVHANSPDYCGPASAGGAFTNPDSGFASRKAFRSEFLSLPETIRCVKGELAIAQALVDLARGHAAWFLPDEWVLTSLTRLSAKQIRAVQLLDACTGVIPFSAPDLRKACTKRVNKRFLAPVLAATSGTADSPPETILRLVVRSIFPDATPQRSLLRQSGEQAGALLTIADLYCESSKLAIFYDGAHHGARAQRDHDYRVDRELQRQGIRVLRFSARDMRDIREVIATLRSFPALSPGERR